MTAIIYNAMELRFQLPVMKRILASIYKVSSKLMMILSSALKYMFSSVLLLGTSVSECACALFAAFQFWRIEEVFFNTFFIPKIFLHCRTLNGSSNTFCTTFVYFLRVCHEVVVY